MLFNNCGKEFIREDHLKKHRLTHLGIEKFVCDWNESGLSFTRNQNLKRHKSNHLNEKKYKCDFYEFHMKFNQKVNLIHAFILMKNHIFVISNNAIQRSSPQSVSG